MFVGTALIYLVVLLAVAAAFFLVASVVFGRGEDLAPVPPSATPTWLPADVVRQMHARSGLTDAVRASTVTVAEAQKIVLDYVRAHVPEPRTAPLAGNSVATDRLFLARDMPELNDYLHYRIVDVSSVKELCRRWYPRVYQAKPEKGLAHRAPADIEESLRELRYYRATAFVGPPGPSSEAARSVAAELMASPMR